jgi:hypothetical protein
MSTNVLAAASIDLGSPYFQEDSEKLFVANTEELASLRYSVILTAKWEASEAEDAERQAELRTELNQLRYLYFDKIDQIAMNFGVQKAINAKEEAERMAQPAGRHN